MRLGVVIGSVRPGRVGDAIGGWVADRARERDLPVDLLDLLAVGLPLLPGEPHHPRSGDYVQESTRAWSRRVAACDAFVLVTPEYNHGYPAALKLALDLLHAEWAGKPVGFASYGGVSGGLRAVQQLKPVVLALGMLPVPGALVVPFVRSHVTGGAFGATELQVAAVDGMLDEIVDLGRRLAPEV